MTSQAPGTELRWSEITAYAAPIIGSFFFYVPMWSILPGIYATYFKLSLGEIAAALLFIRIFDGFIDVAIGYASDWRRSRGGSRKPWVVVGGIGAVVACYFLFNPPVGVTLGYYIGWSLAYFFFFTLSEIPHVTWGSELTLDYHRRAQVFGVRNVAMRLASVAAYGLPLLPIYASTDYTPRVLSDAVWIGASLMLSGLAVMVLAAPAGVPPEPRQERDSFRLLIRSIIRNKPLLLYFAAYAAIGIAGGMWLALLFFFVATYLGLGPQFALIMLATSALAIAVTPLWLMTIRRTSKRIAWLAGLAIFATQCVAALVIEPGGSWLFPFLMVLAAQIFFVCHDTAANSMLGDIIDYGRFRFGRDRGATYFGINTLIFKVGVGVGGSLALATAGFFGFDATTTTQTADAVFGFRLAFTWLPLFFASVGAIFIVAAPISPRRHAAIQRQLEKRLAPAISAANPLPINR